MPQDFTNDLVKPDSGNGLVSLGNKSLPEPMLTKFCDAMPGLNELTYGGLNKMVTFCTWRIGIMIWCFIKAGIILCMHPANERHYNIASSLIGWVHAQNDPCQSFF